MPPSSADAVRVRPPSVSSRRARRPPPPSSCTARPPPPSYPPGPPAPSDLDRRRRGRARRRAGGPRLVDLAAQAVGGALATEGRQVVTRDVGDPGRHRASAAAAEPLARDAAPRSTGSPGVAPVIVGGGDHQRPGRHRDDREHRPQGAGRPRADDRHRLEPQLLDVLGARSSIDPLLVGGCRALDALVLAVGSRHAHLVLDVDDPRATAAAVRSRSARPTSWGTSPRRMAVPPTTSTSGCGRCHVRGEWESS